MNDASSIRTVTGRCLCGAVHFSAKLRNREFGACHCSMCRRWTAGVFLVAECSGLEVQDETSLGAYRSSEWADRCFCKTCGTPLFYRMIGKDFQAVSLEALDDRDGFVFTNQIFIDEKPAYYHFANVTKTMTGAEVFAAFGASEGNSAP